MNPRFVTRTMHAYLDYPVALSLMAAPFLLGLGGSHPLLMKVFQFCEVDGRRHGGPPFGQVPFRCSRVHAPEPSQWFSKKAAAGQKAFRPATAVVSQRMRLFRGQALLQASFASVASQTSPTFEVSQAWSARARHC